MRFKTLFYVSILSGFVTFSAYGDLLNGSFETGDFTGWETFGDYNHVVQDTPRTGQYVAALRGNNATNPNYSGFFQGFPTEEGQEWQLEAYVRHNESSELEGENTLGLKIEFYSVLGAQRDSEYFIEEYSVDALNSNSSVGSWQSVTLSANAPSNAIEARIVVIFIQVNGAGGTALIEDVACQVPDPVGWTLIWSDDFDGSGVDSSKWDVTDLHEVKNQELQYYAPDEVYLTTNSQAMDVMVLRSRARTYSGWDSHGNWGTWNYTSGKVVTYDKFATAYGKIEFRAKLPGTQGMWPALWAMPIFPHWPPEIDIMEMIGSNPWSVHMSLHWGPLGPNGEPPWEIGQTSSGTYSGPDFTQDFHTYGCEWFPNRIFYSVDGVVRHAAITSNVPDEPFYLIMNTAVGGMWPGPPDGSTIFPQYHEIDYVRVYMPDDPGAGVVEWTDTTRLGAVCDGSIEEDEYSLSTEGINNGMGGRIGAGATFYCDSDSQGDLQIAMDSIEDWSLTGQQGVVIYLDTQEGGYASTYEVNDATSISRRLVSGRGINWERSDLFFAMGFLADYAITVTPARVYIYRLDRTGPELVNGATIGATQDFNGGQDVLLMTNPEDMSARELKVSLEMIGSSCASEVMLVATGFDASSAVRFNEFVGVESGNSWDNENPGQIATVLKPGDFLRFRTTGQIFDSDRNDIVDLDDFAAFQDCLAGPADEVFDTDYCLGSFDCNSDNKVDLLDFAGFQKVFEAGL